jgi:hypothetical protein
MPTMQSDTITYTIGKVTLVSPANGSVVTSATPTLSWQAYPGATLYHVDVSTSAKFGKGTVSATAAGTSATSPMTLAHGRTYYWRVYADITTGISVAQEPVLMQGKAIYRKATSAGTTLYSDTWSMTY